MPYHFLLVSRKHSTVMVRCLSEKAIARIFFQLFYLNKWNSWLKTWMNEWMCVCLSVCYCIFHGKLFLPWSSNFPSFNPSSLIFLGGKKRMLRVLVQSFCSSLCPMNPYSLQFCPNVLMWYQYSSRFPALKLWN